MRLPAFLKHSALKPDVQLQEHQQRIADEAGAAREAGEPYNKLLVWQLGSGKSLGALAAAERIGGNYVAAVPASLRENIKGEARKFTTSTPEVFSHTAIGSGQKPEKPFNTLIVDEMHRLRNPSTAAAKAVKQLAQKSKANILLTGSPLVNGPEDLAVPVSILTGENVTPKEFKDRFVDKIPVYAGPLGRLTNNPAGFEQKPKNLDALKQMLKGKVDWYEPDRPLVATNTKDIEVTMSDEQDRLYHAMWQKLPFYLKWKLRNDVGLTDEELQRAVSFMTGPRQAGLSIYPYMAKPDPIRAFELSPKLQAAYANVQEALKNKQAKALVFSNYIDAGLTPYAAALQRAGVPHAVFHGGLKDSERKKLVDDYNADKLRVALLGPSGTEGLSFKGTSLLQLLDPHFQDVRSRQAVGRGVRFGSHDHLPEDMQNVQVQRFISRLPPGTVDSILSWVGLDRQHKTHATDDILRRLAAKKENINNAFMQVLKEVGTQPQPKAQNSAK